MLIDIIKAVYIDGHRLRLIFEDGVEGELDFAKFLSFKGVFSPLREPSVFAQVRVNPDLGTICWPNGADYAPEALYAKITGKLEVIEGKKTEYAEA